MYLTLASDWDLDAAFVSAAKPYLQLKMDVKPSEDSELSSVSSCQITGVWPLKGKLNFEDSLIYIN